MAWTRWTSGTRTRCAPSSSANSPTSSPPRTTTRATPAAVTTTTTRTRKTTWTRARTRKKTTWMKSGTFPPQPPPPLWRLDAITRPRRYAPSAFQRAQDALARQIKTLEARALDEKTWLLKGEASAKERPKNSVLEADVEFDHVAAPPPAVSEEMTAPAGGCRRQGARRRAEVRRRRTLGAVDARRPRPANAHRSLTTSNPKKAWVISTRTTTRRRSTWRRRARAPGEDGREARRGEGGSRRRRGPRAVRRARRETGRALQLQLRPETCRARDADQNGRARAAG